MVYCNISRKFTAINMNKDFGKTSSNCFLSATIPSAAVKKKKECKIHTFFFKFFFKKILT